jgi:hypothetical protein
MDMQATGYQSCQQGPIATRSQVHTYMVHS